MNEWTERNMKNISNFKCYIHCSLPVTLRIVPGGGGWGGRQGNWNLEWRKKWERVWALVLLWHFFIGSSNHPLNAVVPKILLWDNLTCNSVYISGEISLVWWGFHPCAVTPNSITLAQTFLMSIKLVFHSCQWTYLSDYLSHRARVGTPVIQVCPDAHSYTAFQLKMLFNF